MTKIFRRGAAGVALLLSARDVFAQAKPASSPTSSAMLASADTMLLHGLRYRNVGPPRGGRVTTVTGVPSQPRTFYMGVASGGLFRTTDAGSTWAQSPTARVARRPARSTSRTDPNTTYLARGRTTFEQCVHRARRL